MTERLVDLSLTNWGGWWERLVRSVKSSLKKSLGRSSVAKVELETILHEVEASVNSRPLTYIAEHGQVLTPSHFLIGRGSPLTSTNLENFQTVSSLSARKEFEESLTRSFWEIWEKDYLRNLPPLTQTMKKAENTLELNSVVLIKDEKKPRLVWALGKVTKLFEGIDGKVRAAQLKTEKGTLVRSINQICLLEGSSPNSIEVPLPVVGAIVDNVQSHSAELVESPGPPKVSSHGQVCTTRSGRQVKPKKKLDI